MSGIDPRDLRDACGSFATGVTVISTRTEEGDHGMTANAFMSVSLDPPLITISLDHNCKLREKVRASGRYAVSVLNHEMEGLAMHFAGRHDPAHNDPFIERAGMPVVPGAACVFVTEVAQEVEAGDHTLFIGKVVAIERDLEARPLLFCGGKFGALAS
ncbi:flavin reductase (DIM6/NTAB) family NADH-FMN oxidoreductase RutF [Thioclava sp. ES.031]|uniref:flavin reductase family protein n=1 Tax=Thioclava sp. ES.031 TaxID=1798203 RepID=UPI000BF5EF4B|nr:flavin reductase family protein [Thioclava sp. ES.031]PFG62997.1 flavin reductase (DIM6/NTAB) family NADH-FMN oxidoreductase RutF [Thioclava sp. ES.031]